ncbi:MAG TPA: redoxin domain-containing protein [Acidimicrobiales bacterium]|nr:redoxin domain-containing protein [Acidimicrobiales bacterium]
MSTASTRPQPRRPSGAARRRAEAERRKRKRMLSIGGVVAALGIVTVVVALHVTSSSSGSARSSAASLEVGTRAPNGAITTLSGRTETVAALRGRATLIWFVTTWCSSCQAGTQAMAENVAALSADGVRVVEVENYADLGQSGPPMAAFARDLAGSAFSNPDWTFGEASSNLTHTYNPRAYLDIYYLINAKGRIIYVNSSPASTMSQLLAAAKALR